MSNNGVDRMQQAVDDAQNDIEQGIQNYSDQAQQDLEQELGDVNASGVNAIIEAGAEAGTTLVEETIEPAQEFIDNVQQTIDSHDGSWSAGQIVDAVQDTIRDGIDTAGEIASAPLDAIVDGVNAGIDYVQSKHPSEKTLDQSGEELQAPGSDGNA